MKAGKKEIQKVVGQRIRDLRKEMNMSQIELSKKCNFERSNMNRIEQGNTNPTLYTLFLVAEGLEVSITDLIVLPSGVNK